MKYLLLAATMTACAPKLQVALWQDRAGMYVATMRCSASGQQEVAEVRSTSLLRPHTPTGVE